ncbi:hypothetical protein [Thiocystis violascens]|uniref:hypothetical protein n=1 Tax=Thiocystis violascens TaxID=73141 RepID=UPI0012F694B0|nr:hypothetical protein [Thiocystis violascens]
MTKSILVAQLPPGVGRHSAIARTIAVLSIVGPTALGSASGIAAIPVRLSIRPEIPVG